MEPGKPEDTGESRAVAGADRRDDNRRSSPESGARVETAVFNALLASVGGSGGRSWRRQHPYLTTYLADHALAVGTEAFEGLIEDAGFLCAADPRMLMPALAEACSSESEVVRVYRRARPQLGLSSTANAAYLQEASLALTAVPLDLSGTGVEPMYRPQWNRVRVDRSLHTLVGHEGRVNSVALGSIPGGPLVLASGGYDRRIRLWDPESGALTRDPLVGHLKPVLSMAIARSAGALLLASGAEDGEIRLWNALTGEDWGVGPLSGHRGPVNSVALCRLPRGGLLLASGGADGTIRLWNPLTGGSAGRSMVVRSGSVRCLALAAQSGRKSPLLVSAEDDGAVRVWNVQSGSSPGKPLLKSYDQVEAVAFGEGPGKRLVVASAESNGYINLWNLQRKGRPEARWRPYLVLRHGANQPDVEPAGALDVTFGLAPNGRLVMVSAGSDRMLRYWDPDTGRSLGGLVGHGGRVLSVATTRPQPDTMLIASAGVDSTVRVWQPTFTASRPTRKAQRAAGPAGSVGSVTSVAFSLRDSGPLLLASGGSDGAVRLWDPLSGQPLRKPVRGHSTRVDSLAFGSTETGRLLLASAGADGVRMWDPIENMNTIELSTAPKMSGTAISVAFGRLSDGTSLLAVGTSAGQVHFLDPLTGRKLGEPFTDRARMALVAFGRRFDGHLILAVAGRVGTGETGHLHLIDVDRRLSGEEPREAVQTAPAHRGGVYSLSFGVDAGLGDVLVSGGDDGGVHLRAPASPEPIDVPLAGHRRTVQAVASGGTRAGRPVLASAARSGDIKLWDPEDGRCVMTIQRRAPARAVALTGSSLAIGDNEGLTLVDLG
jgi:WD40 repeat protein